MRASDEKSLDTVRVDSKKLSKVTSLIKSASENSNRLRNKPAILVVGPTDAGKSTTIGYLLGYKMKNINEKGAAIIIAPADKDIYEACKAPKIGQAKESETLFSEGFALKDADFLFIDCPGVFENRGLLESMCTSVSTQLSIKAAREIKGVMITIAYSTFDDTKSIGLEKLSKIFGSLLMTPADVADSLFFVITKYPREIDENRLLYDMQRNISGLIDKNTRLLKSMEVEIEERRKKAEEEYNNAGYLKKTVGFLGSVFYRVAGIDRKQDYLEPRERQDVDNAVNAISLLSVLSKSKNIIFIDPLDSTFRNRNEILAKLKGVQGVMPKNEFNFGGYDEARCNLDAFIFERARLFIEQYEKRNSTLFTIQNIKSQCQEKRREIVLLNEQLKSLEDDQIDEKSKQIKHIQSQIDEKNSSLRSLNLRIAGIEDNIRKLKDDLAWLSREGSERIYYEPYFEERFPVIGLICRSTKPFGYHHHKPFRVVERQGINDKKNMDNGVFQDIQYGTTTIKDTITDFPKEAYTYKSTYTSKYGEDGDAAIEVWQEFRIINKDSIELKEEEIKNKESDKDQLNIHLKELEKEIDELKERLENIHNDKLSKQEQVCQCQNAIHRLEKQIKEMENEPLQEAINILQNIEDKMESEREDVGSIKDVCELLEFSSDMIVKFIELYCDYFKEKTVIQENGPEHVFFRHPGTSVESNNAILPQAERLARGVQDLVVGVDESLNFPRREYSQSRYMGRGVYQSVPDDINNNNDTVETYSKGAW